MAASEVAPPQKSAGRSSADNVLSNRNEKLDLFAVGQRVRPCFVSLYQVESYYDIHVIRRREKERTLLSFATPLRKSNLGLFYSARGGRSSEQWCQALIMCFSGSLR